VGICPPFSLIFLKKIAKIGAFCPDFGYFFLKFSKFLGKFCPKIFAGDFFWGKFLPWGNFLGLCRALACLNFFGNFCPPKFFGGNFLPWEIFGWGKYSLVLRPLKFWREKNFGVNFLITGTGKFWAKNLPSPLFYLQKKSGVNFFTNQKSLT
jgi:hypothetical protein